MEKEDTESLSKLIKALHHLDGYISSQLPIPNEPILGTLLFPGSGGIKEVFPLSFS